MVPRRTCRRLAALGAAYAIALQVLLSAFIPVALAVSWDGAPSICFGGDSQAGGGPEGQPSSSCPCVMAGCGFAGHLPEYRVAPSLVPVLAGDVAPAASRVAPATAPRGPQNPRAPPFV